MSPFPAPMMASSKPRHIAIVMDGNGRWANARHRPRTFGHRAGARAAGACVETCLDEGIEVLTLFAFSSENWQRPKDEVGALMQLFLRALDKQVGKLHRHGVKLRFIGERRAFSPEIVARMAQAEALTAENTRLTLCIAADYGGRWDLTQAARAAARDVLVGGFAVESLDEAKLASYLSQHDLPDVDLFIRTGGERRISNFLLWQMAYAELYFTDTLWPDFDAASLALALEDYSRRERRFGLISEQITERVAGVAS